MSHPKRLVNPALAAITLVLAGALPACSGETVDPDLQGVASVIDGDTIEIHATQSISTTAIKADNAIGIETWGAVSSKTIATDGLLRIEAYQGVKSAISAGLAASVVFGKRAGH